MGASHSALARSATPAPMSFENYEPALFTAGPRYRLVKTNGTDYRVLWDGHDLKDLYHTLNASRSMRLPWWRDRIGRAGIKVMIRFEKCISKQESGKLVPELKNGKIVQKWKEGEWVEQWIECEDPRFADGS